MKLLTICFLTLFIGCKRDNEPKPSMAEKLNYLAAKKLKYCELSAPAYKERLWVHSPCDGLLFTSLRAASCGDVDITVFESKEDPGLWFRDPKHSCDLESNSISNDMMLGLIYHAVRDGKKDILQRILDRAKPRDWEIGTCDEAHKENCRLWPSLAGVLFDTLGLTRAQLTTTDTFPAGVTGFRAHLAVVHILLNGKVHGAINDLELRFLRSQAERQPKNALYKAIYTLYNDGDQQAAVDLLLDETHFPADKLPNNHEHHCTEYLYQRDDEPHDWAPCPAEPFFEFSGTDLVFAATVIQDHVLKKSP